MSLNIKNPETLQLVRELARRMDVNQTTAVTVAVAASLQRLDHDDNEAEIDQLLHEIWASQPADEAKRVRRNMDGLYDEAGLPR